MFYLLKPLLLLILVIFKLKCNNLFFHWNSVFVCFVCVFDVSLLHQESPDLDHGRWTPQIWGGSVTTFSCASLDFKDARYLTAESLSSGSTPSVVSYSMKTVRQKGEGNLRWVQNIIHALLNFKKINWLLTRLRAIRFSFKTFTCFSSSSNIWVSVSLLIATIRNLSLFSDCSINFWAKRGS
jgi:hypothetical protein